MSAKEYAGPLFFQWHSQTSFDAAHKARESGSASRYREIVYAFLAAQGASGASDEEIAAGCRLPGNTARPRRVELVEAGRVIDSGQRRQTLSGRKAVVWVVAP